MSSHNPAETHEFAAITDPAFANTTLAARCCKTINGKYCGQSRTAAIHQAETPAEITWIECPHCHAQASWWAEGRVCRNIDCEPASDTPAAAEATPPETIWVVSCGVAYYLFRTSANGGIEYILRSTHDARVLELIDGIGTQEVRAIAAEAQLSKLREALRTSALSYHLARMHKGTFEFCKWVKCAAARTAMGETK